MALPSDLLSLAQGQDGVLSWSQLAAGGISPSTAQRAVRLGAWVKVRRGAYLVTPDRAATHSRWVQARAISLTHPGAVLAGGTAALVWGLHQVPAGPAEVVVPAARALRSAPDRRPHVWGLEPGDTTVVRGMAVTTVTRTLLDLLRSNDRLVGLAVLDAAVRRRLATSADLDSLRRRAVGLPGSAHVADLWLLADARAESGLESRVRLRCHEGGTPPDDLQVEVRDDDGALVARADMVFRRRSRSRSGLLIVEADGASVHAAPDAVYRDRVRANRLTALGHDILRFTWEDTVDPLTIPRAVRAAL
jgi:hypothetical protein